MKEVKKKIETKSVKKKTNNTSKKVSKKPNTKVTKTIEKKKKIKLKNKYLVMLLGIAFIIVFLVVAGASYSFFTTRVTSKDIVVYTGDLAVNFQKDGDVISIENAIPMSDTDGMNQAGYTFKVANTGTINALYQIRLEEYADGSSNLPLEYIKMSYSKNNGTYSEPVLLSSLEENLVFTKDNLIETNSNQDTYTVKLWIDIHAPNEVQNKEFKARIVIDSKQQVDGEYEYDNPPVINLNKDQNNNTDINLLVGEAYTELGVASVVDDNDTLQVSNVVTSIQKLVRDTNDNNIYKLTTVNSIDTTAPGVYYVNYAITDTNNNTGRSIRVVTVNRTSEIPTITLNGDSVITVGQNSTYTDLGAVSSTNDPVITLGEVKTSKLGVYIVRYITVDNLGNIASTTRTVNVIEFACNMENTNDVSMWLSCGNINNKNYTTISEVLNDTDTLQALINSNQANDYLVLSTDWASDITANEEAMQYIGANNYSADTLLADSTWLDAIANSTYFESVLNVKVPTMTSNTTPSGEASASSYYAGYQEAYNAWYAFSSSSSGIWNSNEISSSPQWIQYKFERPVRIIYSTLTNRNDAAGPKTAKLQGSNDGSSWVDLTNYPDCPTAGENYSVVFSNDSQYLYYRLYITASNRSIVTVYILQFYGREDVE